MRTATAVAGLLAAATLAACGSLVPSEAARKELLPTGTLRVGIGIGASTSAFWAVRDPTTGQPRGVTVDLAYALARRLEAPVALVVYANSGEVVAAGPKGEWDVAFLPEDAERRKVLDFGPAYSLSTSTYLVREGSGIGTLAEVDRAGVRAAGIANTTTARSAMNALKNTQLQTLRTVDELVAKMRAGEIDAIALGRESLQGLQPQIPGSTILEGHFHAVTYAAAVPKGKPAALAYVGRFTEEAKDDGTVRRALDNAGLKNTPVAP
jgi:polar amino acid transport system substrate-binding protein